MFFYCDIFLSLLAHRRDLNDSALVGLLCSHGCDVHPSHVFLWSAVFAIGWLSPRPCGDCGKAHPYDQLSTPAATAYYRSPRDQTSAPAKSLGIAIQHIMVFARFLRATVVSSACTYALRPSSSTKNRPPTRALCYIFRPAAPLDLSETLQDLVDGVPPSPLSDLVLEPPVLGQSISSLTSREM